MNESIIYFDIETLPTNCPVAIGNLKAGITAPGQFKKPESIHQWLAENGDQALDDLVKKTSLDGLHGRIACIAWATHDSDVYHTEINDTEENILKTFYDFVDRFAVERANSHPLITFCGHNIHGFDLPFIKHRSMINQVKPSRHVEPIFNVGKYSDRIRDTMLMWSPERERRISMEKLCNAFGIEGDGGFNGSMVADAWSTNPQEVIDHCVLDVKRVREVYKRMTFEDKGSSHANKESPIPTQNTGAKQDQQDTQAGRKKARPTTDAIVNIVCIEFDISFKDAAYLIVQAAEELTARKAA